ncbi:unnamed protein product [Rotaria sp. Silwood1]|nr:unnamed protein product [Rotaria sp. Silwood1]CAF4806906.1 unnamed protein product [Rotaria sp. Silwood1]
MYQICQSLTVSLVHPEDVSTLNDQFSLVNEYFQQLNEQYKSPYELIQLDNNNMIPRFSWYKRDLPTPSKVHKPLLCFFNTVTCFGKKYK